MKNRGFYRKTHRVFAAFLCFCILITGYPEFLDVFSVFAAGNSESQETQTAGPIEMKRLSGDGYGFMYYHFVETTDFKAGETYAFLNGVYDYDKAVTMLGSGAILKITEEENTSIKYIRGKYGNSAQVKAYVDVVTRGADFDRCKIGGLYQVPDSGTPVEYRYFCAYSGAQNCGPLYAYSYDTAVLTYENVSASLNSYENQGSEDSSDYTVTLTYEQYTVTLDPESYYVQVPDEYGDKVVIVIEDSSGNTITTQFQGPLAVRYSGNADSVSGVPEMQEAHTGEECVIRSEEPERSGYTFIGWRDLKTGNTYNAGEKIDSMKNSLNLQAQWKDSQAPEFSYDPVQVVTRTSDDDVCAAVKNALTVTDNEPASECTVEVSGTDIAVTSGDKQVTVKVTDKAGNCTEKSVTVNVAALPVSFKNVSFDEDTQALSALLYEPGSDEITETGFVWGVMSSPTVSINNGKAASSTAVTQPDGIISVTADNLQKGVTYYARAYAVSDGIAYYSDEITIGLGIPSYGSFIIRNNGNNTFTVSRTGGTEGEQTVYYRTVNGSAVGGTHFTHKNGTLTFKDGESSKTITITEKGANVSYSGNTATSYSNADRTYSVQLYRVTGGGSLGETTTAERTLKTSDSYKIDKSIYSTELSVSQDTTNKWVTDHSGGDAGDVIWRSDRSQNTNTNKDNFNVSTSISSRYSKSTADYVKETAQYYLYRYEMKAHEDEDGWEHAWMGTHTPNNAQTETKCGGSYAGKPVSLTDSVAGNALWTAAFQVGQGYSTVKTFPTTLTSKDEDTGSLGNTVYAHNSSDSIVSVGSVTYAKISVSDTVYNYFSANGKDQDRWYVESFTDYTEIYDTKEPQLLSVAPMSGGIYKVGDTFTVSLIFDEIVDADNSSLDGVSLNTGWGPAYYAGGADTNVLYFTGTVSSGAESTLKVNSVMNAGNIKDMCSASETACSGGSGTTAAVADTSVSDFSVSSQGIANGTGTAVISVNDDKSKTSSVKYAWSDTASMPVDGWVELDAEELSQAKGSGLELFLRKDPGSGASSGKWYLHVIGTYGTTGAVTYKSACIDFGTAQNPAAGSAKPELGVSADNTDWAKSRTVNIDASGAETLKYRRSGESSWINLDVGTKSVVVTENGYYTFIITAGDMTVTENVFVENIDLINPSASVGSISESGSSVTSKEGVYTVITLPVAFDDGESGLSSVKYAWTDSAAAPSVWNELAQSETQLIYTASESTETTKYLHLKATDAVGNTYSTVSQGYTVISQSAVENNTPEITITGAPSDWTNDMSALEWELTGYEGKNYTVTLPNGKTTKDNKGEFLAAKNGVYTVTVVDEDYGGSNTVQITVDKIDITAPVLEVTGISDKWDSGGQTVNLAVSDSQSGVDKVFYKVVSSASEIPEDGLSELSSGGGSVSVDESGVWYVYYKIYDSAGDDTTGRPANITEGFTKAVRVDKEEPVLTVTAQETGAFKTDGLKLTVKVDYGYSGGSVTTDGETIEGLTADACDTSDTSGGAVMTAEYIAAEKGVYNFTAESGAGKTSTAGITVCEVVFDVQNAEEEYAQLTAAGGKLSEPEEPERQGYMFAGWFTEAEGGERWTFSTDKVSQDTKLYAHWNANGDTKYVVKYWAQNKNGDAGTFDDTNYTLYETYIGYGTTDGTLVLADLAKNIPACTYSVGKVGGSTAENAVILPDGTLEINLYYSRNSISGNVSIEGELLSGETLTARTADIPDDTVLKYQWYYVGENGAGNEDIQGADESTYTPAAAEAGKRIGVRVFSDDYMGELTAETSDIVYGKITGTIVITGESVIGNTLTADVSGIEADGAEMSYQWYRVDDKGNKEKIDTATALTYTLTAEDCGYTIMFEASGTGDYKGNAGVSAGQKVEKKTQTAPSGITYKDETADNKNDGEIYGIDADTMEYRIGSDGEYRDFTAESLSEGTLKGLADGEYQIRYKETEEYKSSEPVSVTIAAGRKYRVTLPEEQTGFSLAFGQGADGYVSYDGSCAIVLKLAEGYSRTGEFKISLNEETNGRIEEIGDGTYVISEITGDIIVTVKGIADISAPELEIRTNTSVWKEIINKITFGLFFKESVTVEITAEDAGSGTENVWYYISEEGLTEDQVTGISEWSEYAGEFSLDRDKKYVVYAKAEDKAGNEAYAGTDGLVVDMSKPVISGVSDGETINGKRTVTVDDKYLDRVTVNGSVITLDKDGGFVLDPKEGEGEYIIEAADKAGNITVCTVYVYKKSITGIIVITGESVIGNTLTADVSGLEADGAEMLYQWYRVDDKGNKEKIDTATALTYTLTAEDCGYTIMFEASGTGDYKGNAGGSAGQKVEKKTQTEPLGITYKDETADNKNDGEIYGIDADTMEYRIGSDGEYRDFTAESLSEGTLKGLADGEYQIRYKETEEYKSSGPVSVTIAAGRKYRVTLPEEQTGFSLAFGEGADGYVSYDGSCEIVLKLSEGYSRTGEFKISLNEETNGRIEEIGDGTYVISEITGDISVSVKGIADISAPELEIRTNTSVWKEIINKITFGLFFKESVTVEITAEDAGSGTENVWYYISEEGLTEDQVTGISEWSEYAGEFSLDKDKKYVVYAKAEDKAGNEAYAGTDGLVVDMSKPVISGVSDGETINGKRTVTVDDKYLERVTVNGSVITLDGDGSFELDPDKGEGEYIIEAADKAGNTTQVTVYVYNEKPAEEPEEPEQPAQPGEDTADEPEEPARPGDDTAEQPGEEPSEDPEEPTRPGDDTEAQPGEESGGESEESVVPGDDNAVQPGDGTAAQPGEEQAAVSPAEITDDASVSTGVWQAGSGSVTVTVVSCEEKYSAGVKDTETVAKAVLTYEQIQLAENGENIEIRIDVREFSDDVSETDRRLAQQAVAEKQQDMPELTLAEYIDISMFIKIGEREWNAVTSTGEPIEVVIDIPDELKSAGREFYIIRVHEGEYTVLEDMDEDDDTITIRTGLFSTYAIAYMQTESAAHKCRLCHICPTFLGICCFVWLALIILTVIIAALIIRSRKKEEKKDKAVS